jgi:hypothetical protein
MYNSISLWDDIFMNYRLGWHTFLTECKMNTGNVLHYWIASLRSQ